MECFEKNERLLGRKNSTTTMCPPNTLENFCQCIITWPDFRSVFGATLTKCIMSVLGFMVKLRKRPFWGTL